METIRSISEFIKLAGGDAAIAASLKVHQVSISRWKSCGIPVDYWKKLNELYDITPDELFNMNVDIWKNRKKGGAKSKEK